MNETTFIGVDLAWRGEKASAAAVLRGERHSARLIELRPLTSFSTVVPFIERHARPPAVVAIDAPLIIRNQEGQRPCETRVSECYGDRHASCHTTNLRLYPDAVSVRLASELMSRGFRHAPDVTDPKNGLVILEVYPHAALVELFQLPSIVRYKKGTVAKRRCGLRELQQLLTQLSLFNPPLQCTVELSEFLTKDVDSLRGTGLKAYEDGLDAIVCAYIAYYYWFHFPSGARLFGDVDSGYIIVPARPNDPAELNSNRSR